MICPYCKVRLDDDAVFCHWCGSSIDPEEVRRQREAVSTKRDSEYKMVGPYYQEKFRTFDENNGGFVASWNWPAFLFGVLWYIFKGMWGKALLMFLVGILLGKVATPLLWIYSGLFGSWDYYLLKVKKTQFWA